MRHDDGVLITGASTAIGQACALQLDRLGFQVFAGVRKVEDGEALKRSASERLSLVVMDVTDQGSIADAAGVVEAAVGERGVGGLVDNAGVVGACPAER